MTSDLSFKDDGLDHLASEYVLGTLSAARRRLVELRLLEDEALRMAVQDWQERLLPLTALADAVEPSALLWQRIESSLEQPMPALATAPSAAAEEGMPVRDDAPAMNTSSPPAPRRRATAKPAAANWWDSIRLWRGLAGGGFAAAAVLAAVLVTRLAAPPLPQYVVVLVAPQDKAPGWVVQTSSSQGISLIPLAASPVAPDKSLQFWTKADSWSGPVSLGLVKPGQAVKIPLDKLPPLQPNQLFELTLEPLNGSPLNRPTGPIQFIGRAVKVV